MLSTQQIGMSVENVSPMGSGEMNERLEADQYTSLAKARVFFERPQRNSLDKTASGLWRPDSAKEYGSLYSPYWQARLADVTAEDQEARNRVVLEVVQGHNDRFDRIEADLAELKDMFREVLGALAKRP